MVFFNLFSRFYIYFLREPNDFFFKKCALFWRRQGNRTKRLISSAIDPQLEVDARVSKIIPVSLVKNRSKLLGQYLGILDFATCVGMNNQKEN